MRGRVAFKFFFPVLFLLSIPLYILPKNFVSKFWVLLDLFPGILGIGMRYIFLLRLAKSVGRNVLVGRNVEVVGWKNMTVGNNVSIHKDCYIDARGGLLIGNDVSIAHSSSLLTFDHTWKDSTMPIRSNPLLFKSIEVKDDVWIGCGCRILAGVLIESRSVVAAGAVVVRDIESFSLVAGVPAKLIKRIH